MPRLGGANRNAYCSRNCADPPRTACRSHRASRFQLACGFSGARHADVTPRGRRDAGLQRRGDRSEERARRRQGIGDGRAGVKTVVADLVEALGQDVLREAPEEVHRVPGGGPTPQLAPSLTRCSSTARPVASVARSFRPLRRRARSAAGTPRGTARPRRASPGTRCSGASFGTRSTAPRSTPAW